MAQMKYFYELTISSSPHVHAPMSTRTIMRDVLIALMPAFLGSIYFFGVRALLVTLVSVAACVLFEWTWCKLRKTDCKIYDMSAMVTGVLIAFVCPVTIPYWCVIIGDFFAIIVVKQLFGGIGKNIVNPALAARAFLFSWPVIMTDFPSVDGVTSATPLGAMHQGQLPQNSLLDLFLGNVGGSLGETSAVLLLVGFVYLLIRKIISVRIPLAFVGTVAVLSFLMPQGHDPLLWCGYQVLSGGLLLGAIFMATDYVTSPVTHLGQIVFGIGCGVITIVIRYFGGYPEGVSYAILVMNTCVVLLDRIGRSRKFGTPKEEVSSK